jgi:3-deoxy-7-phosphoheptulonate synthase
MIIVMQSGASRQQIEHVMERIKDLGYEPHPIYGVERTVIGAIGDERGKSLLQSLISVEGVENLIPILKPFKLASREMREKQTVLEVGGVKVGGGGFAMIAGPCSVESEDQILAPLGRSSRPEPTCCA